MSKTNNLTDFLTNEANAIRTKKGYPSTQKINPQNFASEIESIKTTPTLQSKTVTPSTNQQTVTPSSGFDGLSEVTVNAISPTKAAETYTPKTYDQFIYAGRWVSGTQTIEGSANLLPSNIKKGINIFNVIGNYSSEPSPFWMEDGDQYDIPRYTAFKIYVDSTAGAGTIYFNGLSFDFSASGGWSEPTFYVLRSYDNIYAVIDEEGIVHAVAGGANPFFILQASSSVYAEVYEYSIG